MGKPARRYAEAAAKVEDRGYQLREALGLVQQMRPAAFDESVDLSFRLNVDPRHADQMVRGTLVLPHGTGREVRVVAIASGEQVKDAEESGADFAGGEDLVKKIQEGWLDFDAVVAMPDMMRLVGRLGKILGPRGLMPNPKVGTVTQDIGRVIRELKTGKITYKVDKHGNVHSTIGRCSFPLDHLVENAEALIDAIVRGRPPAVKGRYLRRLHVSSTMGPSIRVAAQDLMNR